jgi:hypothetical protein
MTKRPQKNAVRKLMAPGARRIGIQGTYVTRRGKVVTVAWGVPCDTPDATWTGTHIDTPDGTFTLNQWKNALLADERKMKQKRRRRAK